MYLVLECEARIRYDGNKGDAKGTCQAGSWRGERGRNASV